VKFLVDTQLPVRLSLLLAEEGHDAAHVSGLPNGNRSTDDEVTASADAEDRVVVTKDADFRDCHLLRARPRRLLAVVTGNIDNTALLGLFKANLNEIVAALEESSFVELGRTSLVVHERPGT
jgi:predicted nuclease of predicted toxin-antitoxin system